ASVNEEGLVEAKMAGVAVITVTGRGGVKATCTVTVTDMVRDSLELLYQTWADADLTVYTQQSAAAVTDALEAAKVVLDNPKATRGEMDAAMSALVKALGSLEYGVQKLHLETALQAADAILAIGKNYEDVAALTEAVDAGKEVLANEKASQEEVDNAAYAILDELFRIAKKADISSLESLIEAAEGLPGGNYTSDTLERLKDAIEKAKEVTADQNRGENDIADAYENLIDAIINLKMKGNKAALKAMLIKANQVLKDTDAYVAETVEGLAKVTEDAQVVYDNENALQSEVNEAVKTLTLEVAKARLKGDVNDDGKVDTADSAVVLRASAELMTLNASAAASADVNGDGKADTGDAVLILQYAAEEITAF
ncbi:MAG: dockerin type I repeat-containing protein, partial [Firmicutes bacterium]|nr:dockerin type I repeat-containing protein [Bacillota bacterium]